MPHWRGIEGWFDHQNPADQSDYARACRVEDWIGNILCHTGSAFVMSGDVGPIAWLQSTSNPGESYDLFCDNHIEQEVVVLGCGVTFLAHTLLAFRCAQDIARHVLDDGEIGWRAVLADAAFVVSEDHVHHPV